MKKLVLYLALVVLCALSAPVQANVPTDVRINFQPSDSAIPAGYEPDFGDVYGDRGNGLTYGWDDVGTGNYHTRDWDIHPDQRYDTLNHFQEWADRWWEIELANGTYDVYLVCGDPRWDDQINTLDIEGTVVTDPDGADHFDWYYVTVDVTDGRLTIGPAAGSNNAKICFIEITSSGPPDTTPPAAPTNLTATVINTIQINLDWDDNTESDLSRYNVYRSMASGGPCPYSRIATGVTVSSYNDTALDPNTTYYYVVTAVDKPNNESGYSNEDFATTEPFVPRINFQPSGSAIPAGYKPDFGYPYGDRGDGLTYGWDAPNYYTRDWGIHPDQRYDTLNHFNGGQTARTWEIEVANGTYDIYLVCGDPRWDDQINTLDIEGTVVTDQDGADHFDEYYVTVDVTDYRLTIGPAAGSSNPKICFIEITSIGPPDNTPPIADAGDGQTVHAGTVVTLDGSGSSDPDEDYPLTYWWQITSKPEGSTAELSGPCAVNPSFIADMLGDYIIELVVTDSLGAESAPDSVLVSTYNTPPVADAGPDQAIIELYTTVQLDGSKSYDNEGDDFTYLWTIIHKPSESLAELDDPCSPTPTFVADIHGNYVISLTVTDIFGAVSEPDSVTVSFQNVKPVADAGGNQSVIVGDTVFLDGSGSYDGNFDPLSYSWSFVSKPSESLAELSDANVVNPSFIVDEPGAYVVSLVVNDGFVDSDPANVTIMAITTQEAVAITLAEIIEMVNLLDPESLKNKNLINALTNKINATLAMIDEGLYQDALDKLVYDILQKTNGCADTGEADKNDWIKTCEAQSLVYPLVIEAIELLENLI